MNISELIQKFYNDPKVIELQNYYNSLSFIEILGVARSEAAHSSFLAWLFDSNKNYGLGTTPLKLLLELLVKNSSNSHFPQSIKKEDILIRRLDISQPTNVIREYPFKKDNLKGSIDIYIPFEIKEKRYVIVIENKIKSTENKETCDNGDNFTQTDKYFEFFNNYESTITNTEYIYVFLAPSYNDKVVVAHNKNFINISYSMLAKNILTPLLANQEINANVRLFINDYLRILNKPNTNLDNNSDIVLAISESEAQMLQNIANNHQDLGKFLLDDNNLLEDDKELLNGFKEYNKAVILSIWPILQKRNRKSNTTFAKLGIKRDSELILAGGERSNTKDERNIKVYTYDDESTIYWYNDKGEKIIKKISPAARELASITYSSNGFYWFIYSDENLFKLIKDL